MQDEPKITNTKKKSKKLSESATKAMLDQMKE
jgi:hypothetical protein